MRIELTLADLLVKLANFYTTWGTQEMWNVTFQVSIALVFQTQYSPFYESEEILSIDQNYPPSRNITKVATKNCFKHYKIEHSIKFMIISIWS